VSALEAPPLLPEPTPEPLPVEFKAPPKPKFSLGIGMEFNLMDIGTSFALGATLAVECQFNEIFSVGTFMTPSFGVESVSSIESGLFVRWYMLRLSRIPLELYRLLCRRSLSLSKGLKTSSFRSVRHRQHSWRTQRPLRQALMAD
jgi:hypothetical protein